MDLAKNIKNGDLFITLTLKPDMYKMRARRQYIRSIESVKALLNTFCDRYVLYPELTEKVNVHYHASIHLKDTIPFAKEKLLDVVKIHRLIGNTLINKHTIADIDRTLKYMQKEYNKTKSVILNMKEIAKGDEIYHQKIVFDNEIIAVEKPKKYLDLDYILENADVSSQDFQTLS